MGCNGRGPDGEHCCQIDGGDCQFLVYQGDLPRCGLLLELGSWEAVAADPRWRGSPIARWFDEKYPGFHCGDWPQDIPEVMSNPTIGKCCYSDAYC